MLVTRPEKARKRRSKIYQSRDTLWLLKILRNYTKSHFKRKDKHTLCQMIRQMYHNKLLTQEEFERLDRYIKRLRPNYGAKFYDTGRLHYAGAGFWKPGRKSIRIKWLNYIIYNSTIHTPKQKLWHHLWNFRIRKAILTFPSLFR